jgi:hypothetical protein
MSDRDQLKAVFDRAQIKYHEVRFASEKIHLGTDKATQEIRLGADDPGVEGYSGFFTAFTFNEAGDLLKVGIWE